MLTRFISFLIALLTVAGLPVCFAVGFAYGAATGFCAYGICLVAAIALAFAMPRR
jgi:hypothetical protein